MSPTWQYRFCQAQAELFSDIAIRSRKSFILGWKRACAPHPLCTESPAWHNVCLHSYSLSGDMRRAKLDNMATAVAEIFCKMFSRDDDGLLIKIPFVYLSTISWSCVTALSAVKGSFTKEAWERSNIPEFCERIFFNCFFWQEITFARDLSKEEKSDHLPFP